MFHRIKLALATAICMANIAAGEQIYYTEAGFDDGILRINTDGSDNQFIVNFVGNVDPRGLAVVRDDDRMYYSKGPSLFRSNLDGTFEEFLVESGSSVPKDLEVHVDKLYWSVSGSSIRRSNLDGTDAEILVSQAILDALEGVDPLARADSVAGIAISAGRVYFANHRGLNSIPLGGVTAAGDIINHITVASGEFTRIALDSTGKVYWTNNSGSKVHRANLDGTDLETIADRGFGRPLAILLDEENGKFYFSDTLGTLGRGEILKADLDGSGLEIIYSGSTLFSVLDMEFGPSVILPGDVNGDSTVNLLDVEPFVELVSSGEFQVAADINGDGEVNLLDVGPFIDLLNGD